MTQPLITLAIPTRERADTLKHTLATAVDQDSRNFQILVCDNFSQDSTRDVVASFDDDRVTYVNTGRRLSMTENFNFALEHVRGKYVIYIGDDDGLMQGAISMLTEIIATHPAPVYCWECHGYTWPINGTPPRIVSLTPPTPPHKVDLRSRLEFSIRWGGLRDHLLPKAYHSAVQTSVLLEIKRRTGSAFHSQAPDLFTGYAIPVFAPYAVNTGTALTVAGYSAKANSGRSQVGTQHFQSYVNEFGEYKFHPTLYPGAPYIVNLIQDATLVAMESLPEYYANKRFNYEAMWAYMIRSGRYQRQTAVPEQALRSVIHLLARTPEIRKFHAFSISKFFYYLAVNYAIKYRTALKMSMRRARQHKEFVAPSDVHAFVGTLGPVRFRSAAQQG